MSYLRVSDSDGCISTPWPPGEGWQWCENHRKGDGYSLTQIKWRRASAEGDVSLYAKDYSGVNEELNSICGREWRAYYRPVLPVISRLEVNRRLHAGQPACFVAAEGSSPSGARLHLEERYMAVPDHVLLLSAGGPELAIVPLQKDIETWFSGVVFQTLQRPRVQ